MPIGDEAQWGILVAGLATRVKESTLSSTDKWQQELRWLRNNCDIVKALASDVYTQAPDKRAACHKAVEDHWTKITTADYSPGVDIRHDLLETLINCYPEVMFAFYDLLKQLQNEKNE